MLKILVPTDFSQLSNVAIRYAVSFAGAFNAGIMLLHVIEMVEPATATMRRRAKPVEREVIADAQDKLNQVVSELASVLPQGVNLSARVAKGQAFADVVRAEARKVKADLIVMGTRGASGLRKYIMGSNTASVIEVSKVPVLAVPELAEFKSLSNVVYATDLTNLRSELKTLLPYFGKSDVIIHLVHVTSAARQVPVLEKKIDAVVEETGATNVIVRILVSRNTGEAVDQYITAVKPDLLATFTHEHGFYDKLFDRSFTRRIAFQSKIPLLAFRQKR